MQSDLAFSLVVDVVLILLVVLLAGSGVVARPHP